MKNLLIVLTVLLGFSSSSIAQTCCSGGVPLSSNLGLPPSNGKTLQATLTYDLNVLKTLKSGTEVLVNPNNTRKRRTHSTMMQLGYSFTNRFAVDAFFSYVFQERIIINNGMVSDEARASGIGDAVLLFKYKILALNDNKTVFTAGVGVKFPTGATDLQTSDGFLLNADMQPGSGAWDGIFWGQFIQTTNFRPTLSFTGTFTYALKGVNSNYRERSGVDGGSTIADSYRFGDDIQVMAGATDRFFWGKSILDPGLMFRFRSASQDFQTIFGQPEQPMPSTGGTWLFINPGLTYWFNPDISFNTNVELPLYADITGTQVTPTFRINLGLYYRFSFAKQEEIIIDPLKPQNRKM